VRIWRGAARLRCIRFKTPAQPRLPITPTDDWEWLALAQRHGCGHDVLVYLAVTRRA